MHAPGAVGLEVGFLVLAAGDVVAEHPAEVAALVVSGEERDDGEALHGGGQVAPHHLAELVGLALEREGLALDLLVVLELHLEEAHHLDRGPGGPGDGDAGEVVGREHLLDAAVGDRVPGRGPTVTGHHHAAGEADGEDRRAVGDLDGHGTHGGVREARPREVVRRDLPQQVDEGRPGVEPRAKGGKGWLHHAASLYGGLLGAGR